VRCVVIVLALFWATSACAQSSIPASEAKNHADQIATVCGQVASVRYAVKSSGSPTFINLDRAYPKQIFTIVIWGGDRSKFGDPEVTLTRKRICVTGKITVYRGKAETTVHEPAQIKLSKPN
jgi:hypothetical protein